jgi:putative ATP-dependent endonuclease of OLD family
MYIQRLTIKNYRNFGDPPLTIELGPFTLILGENNVGKTNLLNALALVFSQEITIFRKRMLDIDDINYEALTRFKKAVCDLAVLPESVEFPSVQVDVILADMDDDQKAIAGRWAIDPKITQSQVTYLFATRSGFNKVEWVKKMRETLEGSGQSSDKWTHLIDFPLRDYRYSLFGGNDPSREIEMYWLQMFKMECLEALRDAQKELVASGDYRLLYRVLNQRDEAGYGDIKRLLEMLEEAVTTNPSLASIRDDVTKLLNRVSLQTSPEDNKINFSFSAIETAEVLKKLGLIYGTNPIDVSRNGLGRNNLLYISLILSQLAARDTQGNETHFRLIAVEEPEAHLHPHLQDHLAENIEQVRHEAGGKMQLLLTSHSTHVASRLSLENTVVVYRDTTNGVIRSHYVLADFATTAEDADTILYLKRFLDATKSRMFFSRKIILVEGFAEQFLVPELFKIYRCSQSSLEKEGCNVINVNGVAFKHFLKVVRGGYFVRCLVLTDQDTGKKTENRADELRKDFETPGLICVEVSAQSTFEKDLIEANKSAEGKSLLLEALKATKPINGKEFESSTGANDIDVDLFFDEIEDYKAEFAFNLAGQLQKSPGKLKVPDYIRCGFDFVAT